MIPLFINSHDLGRTDFFLYPIDEGTAFLRLESSEGKVYRIDIEFTDVAKPDEGRLLKPIRKIIRYCPNPPQIIMRHTTASGELDSLNPFDDMDSK